MRKKSAGLLSLVVAAGLGTTLGMPAVTASAAPQVKTAAPSADSGPALAQSDDLPNPAEEKKRALREQALTEVLNGKATPEKRGASTVVKVGTTRSSPRASGPRWSGSRRPSRRPDEGDTQAVTQSFCALTCTRTNMNPLVRFNLL